MPPSESVPVDELTNSVATVAGAVACYQMAGSPDTSNRWAWVLGQSMASAQMYVCAPCPAGAASPMASASCASCVAGYYNGGVGGTCSPCAANTYSPAGSPPVAPPPEPGVRGTPLCDPFIGRRTAVHRLRRGVLQRGRLELVHGMRLVCGGLLLRAPDAVRPLRPHQVCSSLPESYIIRLPCVSPPRLSLSHVVLWPPPNAGRCVSRG